MTTQELLKVIRTARDEGSTVLDLSKSDISYLPPEIGELPALDVLGLKKNKLRTLPPEIGNLTSLRVLSLARNELTELPPEIGNLTNLRELFVSRNRLNFLPPTIGNLKKLRTLSLVHNELISLPAEIGELSQLVALSLNGNKLQKLPYEIVKLTSLRAITLKENPLESPLKDIAENGTYAIMSYLLGLQHGAGFDENVYKQRIIVRTELQTALHQYLVYFTDFVKYAKDTQIDFNVIRTEDGLEMQLRTQDAEQLQIIGRFLQEYVELIGQKLDSFHVNVESKLSDTERQILLVELRNQVRNLQTAVEIRNVRLEYLQSEVTFLRQLICTKVTHPQPIQIDVSSKAEARSASETKVDVRIDIAALQDSFRELVAAMIESDPSLGPEIQPLSDSLSEIDEDVQDKTQIDRPLLERVGRFLWSLTDPKSKNAKTLDRVKGGIRLLQKAGSAYNSVAEWLGLPQVPRVFLQEL